MPDDSLKTHDPEQSLHRAAAHGMRITAWGIVASTVLAAIKVIGGVVGHSYALVADGVESLLDIISSLVVWGGLRVAAQPPTERYPYGFGKAEPLAALAISTVLLLAAAGIAIQSLREIHAPHHLPEPFTLVVLITVIVAKEMMFRFLLRAGESIGSKAMQTDAWHHRSDSLTSIAAFVGISIALYGGEGFESADDWAALFAAAVIAFNGFRLFRSALREVLDVSAPPELIDRVRRIAAGVPGVVGLDKCRIRSSGLILFIDLHIRVNARISVAEGHEIAHRVKDALMASGLGIRDVTIHIEPGEASSSERSAP